MKKFAFLWLGQLVSLFGTGLSGFALGVWVFRETGSVTRFSLLLVSASLPGILAAPLAGALVDRWDRRRVMIVSDTFAALATLTVAALLFADRLEIWHLYFTLAVSSVCNAFQQPAYMASITLLVEKAQLVRASGLVQVAQAVPRILSPPIAGILLAWIQLEGVLLVDVATYLMAMLVLWLITIPRPPAAAEPVTGQRRLGQEIRFGFSYLANRPPLLGLLGLFALLNFAMNGTVVLLTPLVLSFATAGELGLVLSMIGVGLLTGSLLISAWGGPSRRLHGVLAAGFAGGLSLMVIGLRPSIPLIAAATFGLFFSLPVVNGCSQAIWQVKTAPAVQGRVFAARSMLATLTIPVAFLAVGPLADLVFEPRMAAGGSLAKALGPIFSSGPGRGIGLLISLLGVLSLLAVLGFGLSPRLRRLEDELPDEVATTLPVDVPKQ